MSTELLAHDGVYLTRFYGGLARGRCYQITVSEPCPKYIAVTEDQMRAIVEAYTRGTETVPEETE